MTDNHKNNASQKTQTSQKSPVRMGRGPGMMMPGEKARNFKGTMKELVRFLGKYNWIIIAVLIITAGATTFTIIGPKILGQATTLIFEGMVSRISGSGEGIDFQAFRGF